MRTPQTTELLIRYKQPHTLDIEKTLTVWTCGFPHEPAMFITKDKETMDAMLTSDDWKHHVDDDGISYLWVEEVKVIQ